MPPNAPRPPRTVTHSPDERLDFLMLRFEEFKDWQGRVDQRLDENDRNMDAMKHQMQGIATGQKDQIILLQKLELLLRGQREPGLERPGLTDDFKDMQKKCEHLDSRINGLDDWKKGVVNRAIGYGVGAGIGGGSFAVGVKLLIELLTK
ncbi:hypothetical protein [Hymenobacter latericus]|uniref:hypothetical protein n=1 Tax=Hymenobacter sp. YIM 151858-1 TaxID=2987688 RepID=UPI002225CD08|nr:hypothetical protein [Hymenobacter sp. YIM 151858-1]UYZ60132.1 hypothetical protein OIS50_04850 [Hymenobacter sp. YIM 151858-1]